MAQDTLTAALEEQLHLLEEFFDLLSRETRELSDIQIDAMAEINIRKENIGARIETHSAVLRKEIEEAALREGLSSKTTLGELASVYGKRGQQNLAKLQEELGRIADRIRQAISINSEIAERFAASLTSSLGLLTRIINQSNTYGAFGAYQRAATGAVLINREA